MFVFVDRLELTSYIEAFSLGGLAEDFVYRKWRVSARVSKGTKIEVRARRLNGNDLPCVLAYFSI